MKIRGGRAQFQGNADPAAARARVAGLRRAFPRHYQECGRGARRSGALLAQLPVRKLRRRSRRTAQWRHALLGGVALPGSSRGIHTPVPTFHVGIWISVVPDIQTVRKFAEPQDLDVVSPVMQAHQKNAGGNERIRTYMLREYHEPRDVESFLYVSQVLQAEAIKVGAEHLRRQRPRTMGSLYWQLNDCWPVASWASIDYYGHWKALQYYAR